MSRNHSNTLTPRSADIWEASCLLAEDNRIHSSCSTPGKGYKTNDPEFQAKLQSKLASRIASKLASKVPSVVPSQVPTAYHTPRNQSGVCTPLQTSHHRNVQKDHLAPISEMDDEPISPVHLRPVLYNNPGDVTPSRKPKKEYHNEVEKSRKTNHISSQANLQANSFSFSSEERGTIAPKHPSIKLAYTDGNQSMFMEAPIKPGCNLGFAGKHGQFSFGYN